jgi:hypothetical protein
MVERFAGKMLLETRMLKEFCSSILVIVMVICFLQSSVSKNRRFSYW